MRSPTLQPAQPWPATVPLWGHPWHLWALVQVLATGLRCRCSSGGPLTGSAHRESCLLPPHRDALGSASSLQLEHPGLCFCPSCGHLGCRLTCLSPLPLAAPAELVVGQLVLTVRGCAWASPALVLPSYFPVPWWLCHLSLHEPHAPFQPEMCSESLSLRSPTSAQLSAGGRAFGLAGPESLDPAAGTLVAVLSVLLCGRQPPMPG